MTVLMTIDSRQATEIVRALKSLKRAMQSMEGLICSHIYIDAEAPTSVTYVEEWRAPEDLGQEAVLAHLTQLFGLMERSATTPVLCLNWISETRGMEYIETVMRRPCTAVTRTPSGDARNSDQPLARGEDA